jgi:hypothetical protein
MLDRVRNNRWASQLEYGLALTTSTLHMASFRRNVYNEVARDMGKKQVPTDSEAENG